MVRVGDLVWIFASSSIAIVIDVTTTAYGWQRLWVQCDDQIFQTSTLQVELLKEQ